MIKHRILHPVAVLAAGFVILPLVGCKKQKPANAPTTELHTYTVRAEVRSLPVPNDPRTEFTAKHEAIPEYMGPKGVLGMGPMVMPFPLKDGVSLEGIDVGDKVDLTFEVVYNVAEQMPTDYHTIRVVELPADTVLDFSPLRKRDNGEAPTAP